MIGRSDTVRRVMRTHKVNVVIQVDLNHVIISARLEPDQSQRSNLLYIISYFDCYSFNKSS